MKDVVKRLPFQQPPEKFGAWWITGKRGAGKTFALAAWLADEVLEAGPGSGDFIAVTDTPELMRMSLGREIAAAFERRGALRDVGLREIRTTAGVVRLLGTGAFLLNHGLSVRAVAWDIGVIQSATEDARRHLAYVSGHARRDARLAIAAPSKLFEARGWGLEVETPFVGAAVPAWLRGAAA